MLPPTPIAVAVPLLEVLHPAVVWVILADTAGAWEMVTEPVAVQAPELLDVRVTV